MRKIKFEETEVETFKATVATALGIHVEDIVQGPTVVAQYDARRALETPAREEHGRPPPAWGASFAKSFLGLLVGFPDCLRALRLLALRFLDVHREGSPGRGAMSRVTRGSLGPPPGGVGGGGLPPSGISSAQAAARPHHRLIGAKVAGLREVAAGGAKVAGMREVAAGGVQRRLEVPGSMLVELTAILPFDTTAMIDELFASKEFLAALNASGFSVLETNETLTSKDLLSTRNASGYSVLETNVISIDAADHTLLIVGLCCALPPLLALLVCWRQVARGYAVRTKARGDAVAPFGGSALALHLNPGDDDHFRLGGPSSAKPRTEISGGATPGGPRVKSLRPSYTGTTPAAEIERDGGGSKTYDPTVGNP
ncbi:hypothetical protein T484DRAFT_1812147 [Baffinella frigidus]|nr:hypothetical protein T484DRAFT_1812147 [Cryptophyta sp. CCMP2293]